MSFFCAWVLVYSSFVNTVIGETPLAIVSLVLLLVQLLFYYFSRVKRMYFTARIIFAVISQIFIILNYFFNAGIDGPTLIVEFIVFFFLVIVFPNKQAFGWVALTLFIPLAAIITEYHFPWMVEGAYSSRYFRFMDVFLAYFFAVIFVVLNIIFLKGIYAKQVKTQQAQAEKLDLLNKENQKLFSIISHDLRSPLATIEGYLKEISQSSIPAELKQKLEQELLLQTTNTAGMLDNLLFWSKNNLEGITFEPVRFNLVQVMSETLFILENSASRKGIKFICDSPSDLTLTGEPRQIEILIRNLIQNAIKFTMPGGEIKLVMFFNEKDLVLTVEDTGVGMSQVVLDELFVKNIESTFGTKNEKGIGIGLKLCVQIVQIHSGVISVESTLEKGTKFTVSIPLG